MGFFFVEKDIRGKSAEWLRDEIRNTKAFTKFSIDFVKNALRGPSNYAIACHS